MAGEDKFKKNAPGITDPSGDLVDITPNDDADLAKTVRGIYVGGAGNLRVVGAGNGLSRARTFYNVPAGTTLVARIRRVMMTGTTATNLVGMV